MSKSLRSPAHEALCAFIRDARKAAGLTQTQVADKLERYQSYVAMLEGGERKIDVIEFIQIAKAIGFDPAEAVRKLAKVSEE